MNDIQTHKIATETTKQVLQQSDVREELKREEKKYLRKQLELLIRKQTGNTNNRIVKSLYYSYRFYS